MQELTGGAAIAGRSPLAGLRAWPHWRHVRFWGGWIGASMLVAWAFMIIWWSLLETTGRETAEELIIPDGTAAAIAAGDATSFLPSQLSVPVGGVLRVVNQDIVEHTIGTATVPPGAVAEIAAPSEGQLSCTIHPSGYLGVRLSQRPGFLSTMVPSIVLGAPVGALIAAVAWVASRIGASEHA